MMGARVRTLPEAVRCIRETDPDSALTPHALRKLVLAGAVPCIRIGAKRLVDMDVLERFLSGLYTPPQPERPVDYGSIRRLPERMAR